jgi:hypothetical protein
LLLRGLLPPKYSSLLIGLSLGYQVHLQTGSVQIKNPWSCTPRRYSDKTNQALIFPVSLSSAFFDIERENVDARNRSSRVSFLLLKFSIHFLTSQTGISSEKLAFVILSLGTPSWKSCYLEIKFGLFVSMENNSSNFFLGHYLTLAI